VGGGRDLRATARLFSATILVGALVGGIVGGLGGRLAMRILFITSGDSVKGATSDDGFRIGQFTLADTIGLVITTALLGILAALLYLAAQPFVARFGRFITPMMAVFYGVVGGAVIVQPDGVDFSLLEPALLAIALFVLIIAAFGALVSHFVNGAAREDSWAQRWSWWVMGPPLVALAFPPLLIVAAAAFLLHQVNDETRGWRALRVGAIGTMGLMFSLAAMNLTSDVAALS